MIKIKISLDICSNSTSISFLFSFVGILDELNVNNKIEVECFNEGFSEKETKTLEKFLYLLLEIPNIKSS